MCISCGSNDMWTANAHGCAGAVDGKKRILIMMSNTGGGHRASAEAIKAACMELYGDRHEVSACSAVG